MLCESCRLFWIVVCALATIVLINYSKRVVENISTNPVSFVQETAYLHWTTEFPSVSVCETDADLGNIEEAAEKLFGADRHTDVDGFVREIAFFEGTCFSCTESCGSTINCSSNITEIAKKVRAPCEDLLSDCEWSGNEFDCCENFLPLQTEYGRCFTINSLQTVRKSHVSLHSNASTGPGKLSFSAHNEIYVILHGKEDLPFFNMPEEYFEMIMLSSDFVLKFKINEIENDPGVFDIPIESRKCRFPSEPHLKHHQAYSYSACITECRLQHQLKLCNCTHHFMRSSETVPICNLHQFECLSQHSEKLKRLKPPYSSQDGLTCRCESSCSEPDLDVISKQTSVLGNGSYSRITVELQNLPSTRFRRYVTRAKVDNFVTVGGLLGLYLGASVLSLVEIIYYLFMRKELTSPYVVIKPPKMSINFLP